MESQDIDKRERERGNRWREQREEMEGENDHTTTHVPLPMADPRRLQIASG